MFNTQKSLVYSMYMHFTGGRQHKVTHSTKENPTDICTVYILSYIQ